MVEAKSNAKVSLCNIFENITNLPEWWSCGNNITICTDWNQDFVECQNNSIIKLDLSNHNLFGQLNLFDTNNTHWTHSLKSLNLRNNSIYGDFDFNSFNQHSSNDSNDSNTNVNIEFIDISMNNFNSISNLERVLFPSLTQISFGMFCYFIFLLHASS